LIGCIQNINKQAQQLLDTVEDLTQQITKFYVYSYARSSNGTPYHIGKGCGWRMFSKQHSVTVPKDRSKIQIIAKNLSESEAHQLEAKLISIFGRKDLGTGILHNRSNGGEGSSGAYRSAETRAKISASNTGKKLPNRSEIHRKRLSDSQKGIKRLPLSKEHRDKIGQAHKGKTITKETTDKWRKSMELRKQSGVIDIRNIKKVTCPHCNKTGGGGNMTRYHFNNCKNNE